MIACARHGAPRHRCNYPCALALPRSRPRRAWRALLAVLPAAAGLLAAEAPLADAAPRSRLAPCDGAELQPTAADGPAVEAATLCLVDQIRAAHHLPPLRGNSQLASAAQRKLSGMVHLNYFADVDPFGQTARSLIAASRYPAHAASVVVGQNLAWGSGAQTTPASIVAAWMVSPPHRGVLLQRVFRDAGVAVSTTLPPVLGNARGATYALELARRSR